MHAAFEVAFYLGIAIAVVELVMSGTWRPSYFRHGIPLFRKRIVLPSPPELSATALSERFSGGPVVPILFREIGKGEIAFREALVTFLLLTYTPVMHGRLSFDHETNTLEVVGIANWFIPAFALLHLVMSVVLSGGAVAALLVVLVLLAIYAIQYVRYTRVFDSLRAELDDGRPSSLAIDA